MHLRSLPAWTPWPPWPSFRRYRELSGSRLASLPRGPTLPSEVPWPPTPSLSGRLHVHDPSLSFSGFTPSTCLALFKFRSEISASRALFLIALADTGGPGELRCQELLCLRERRLLLFAFGYAEELRGRRLRETSIGDPGGPVLCRLYPVGQAPRG